MSRNPTLRSLPLHASAPHPQVSLSIQGSCSSIRHVKVRTPPSSFSYYHSSIVSGGAQRLTFSISLECFLVTYLLHLSGLTESSPHLFCSSLSQCSRALFSSPRCSHLHSLCSLYLLCLGHYLDLIIPFFDTFILFTSATCARINSSSSRQSPSAFASSFGLASSFTSQMELLGQLLGLLIRLLVPCIGSDPSCLCP